MRTAIELRTFVREARALLAREKDLAQFEVYCASGEHSVARLAYTSDIPCRGVEEMKSHVADGFALRIVTRRDAPETGMAAEAGDLSLDALRAALARARRATLVDPRFSGLPREPLATKRRANSAEAAGGDLARAGDARLGRAAWRIIGGALQEFATHRATDGVAPGLVLGGDVSLMRDRMAIASSNFDDLRIETGAHFTCMVTALVESLDTKGTASAVGATLTEMDAAAARAGSEAVERALALAGGERPPGGAYRVVLGAQPVAELLNYMVVPSLTTGAFYSASSAYHGRFNAQVMDRRIGLYDDPAALRGAIRRRLTCEGLRARRTALVREGRLVGLLSNFYDGRRLETDEHRREKLGPSADPDIRFPPNSGYRLGESAVRRFDSRPGSTGTNLVMRTRRGASERELIRAVGEGIYVGRVWYTYPINGQRAGDFTCTVSGDSYLIRKGALAAPLAPNALRINANIEQIFAHPLAVGNSARAALVWGAPEAYYSAPLAAKGISLSAIEAPASTIE